MPVIEKRQPTVSRKGSSLLATTWLLSCIALGCLALSGLFGGQADRSSDTNLVKPSALTAVASEVSDSPYVTKSIRDIRIGERVLAHSPEVTEQERRQAIEPDSSWQHLQLEMKKADDSILKIELLRPREWVVSHNAYAGTTIHLDLEEMGASGPARVVNIGRAPPIARGSGEVVTGTFSHSAGNVINLYVDGLDHPIGTTDNHPFWSEDRQAFIPAGDLQSGERLRTENGNLLAVIISSPSAADAVFNLEVNTEHVYFASRAGLLVHNSYLNDAAGSAAAPFAGQIGSCSNCADAVLDAVGDAGELVKVQSRVGDFIAVDGISQSITRNGLHEGVLVDGLIHDNINLDGILPLDWFNSMFTQGGLEVLSP